MFGSGGFGGFGAQQNQQQQQQQQPQQQQGGGLFGGGGGFGGSTFGAQQATPAFGQQQPAQPTGFGAFGGGAATSTPAFGASTAAPSFGAPASGGGLFGGASSTPAANTGFSFGGGGTSAFGAPQTSAAPASSGLFGAPKPASTFSGFGQPATPAPAAGGLFGAAAPKPATGFGGFGQAAPAAPAAGGGLFGGGGGGFGQPAAAPGTGTAVAPYQATTVMEPPKEEGKPDPPNQTPHSFQSICCMPQYQNYSFEELRLQDYQANRKVPTAGSTSSFGGGGFGAPAATPAFGAPAQPSGGLFGSSSTPAFGSAAPATGGFGAPAQPSGGLFGGGASTGAFGQPAQPAASGGLFGSSQPAAGGGLFGAPKPATGGFGQPAASAAPTFGGFGQPAASAAPATGGFSFGQPAASAAPATGGLFGQASAAPASGGLFGQPAQPAAGGLFGQPATSQPAAAPSFSFGAAPAKPLFGAAPAAPAFGASTAQAAPKPAFSFGAPAPAGGGGLFGQPAAQPAAPAFGQQQPAQGGGLFGGGSTFGQQPATSAAPSFGGAGLFGAKPAAPAGGSLFGQSSGTSSLFGQQPAQQQQQQQQQQPGSLFGSTLGSSFGGNSLNAQSQQPTAYAVAEDANAYGSNPLFHSTGNVSPAKAIEEKKKPPVFRGTPVNRSSTKITRLRGFGSSTTPNGGSPLSFGSSVGAGTPGSPGGRASPFRLINGAEEAALSTGSYQSRPSVKKLVIDRKSMNESPFGGDKSRGSPSLSLGADKEAAAEPKSNGQAKVTFKPEAARGPLFGAASSSSQRSPEVENETFGGTENTPIKRSGGSSANLGEDTSFGGPSTTPKEAPAGEWSSRRPTTSAAPAHPPKHGEYYTVPSIDSLKKLSAHSLRHVKDLVVGRVGYGSVAFTEPVDLTTLGAMEDLLGGIVVFEDRNCTVYPDDLDSKPRPGQGLNVPATITLERCWPLDKATRQPIKEGPRLEKHVKRLQGLRDTHFVAFEDGEWTFGVTEVA